MDEKKHLSNRRSRACGQLKFVTAFVVEGGGATASLSGWLQLWEKVALLAQALSVFGPFKRGRVVEIVEGAVHVDVCDASENQDFVFDEAAFEMFCRGVGNASAASEKHNRERSEESSQRLEQAHGLLNEWDADGVGKLIERMKEHGGLELISHAGELIQVGPKKKPRPIRPASNDLNLEMEVASLCETVCVETDVGEFLSTLDGEAGCVEVGDVVKVVPDAEGGLVRCATADAAIHADDQFPIPFNETPRQPGHTE